VLAIPAIFHSHAAINSLFNRPGDWIPDSLAVKQDFNAFLKHFSVSDLIMIAWEGSDLDSESLDEATLALQPLVEPGPDVIAESELELPESVRAKIETLRQESGLQYPLRWVRSGTETLEQLTSSPANLSRGSAVRRLQGSLIGDDGEQTCLVLSFSAAGLEQRRVLIPGIREMIASIVDLQSDQVAVVGGPFEGATVDAESVRSIRVFSPPSALIAALLCLICLRSIPLTGAIVAVAVIGEGLVLAAVYYTGTPMNAVLIVLPPLVFVLTVSAGIHLSNYYLDAAADFPELSRAEAAQLAMKAGVPPCSLATGTTVVGLSSLLLVRLEPVRIFGGVASLGVILTLVLLFLLIPGAMVLTKPRRRSHADVDEPRGGLAGWARMWMRRRLARPWPMIISFLVVAGGLSFGLTKLESTVNVPRMFLPESDIRRQYAWFEESVAPTVTGELMLAFPPLTEEDDPLKRLAVVGRTHARLLELEQVGGALSAMTFVPSVPRRRSLSATAQRSVIRKLIRDPDSSLGRLGFIARDPDDEIWRISIRMPQNEEKDFAEALVAIQEAVDEVLEETDSLAVASLTGSVVIVQKSQEVLLNDLFRSFMTAFAVIAVVMVLMLRSFVGGLIAMAPNLFPTVALFGLMGLARIPLDIGSVMSASVALGIAVDDTVHLLSRYGSRRARGLGQIRAAYGALEQCGWAMFQTTLVCGVSLMAYWFSDFVPTSRFSLFMFGLLASALLGVLLLLPALMASPLGRWLSHTIGVDPDAALFADVAESGPPKDIRRLPTRWQKQVPHGPTSLPDSKHSKATDSGTVQQDSTLGD
ncbi:MAG: efflux RND transporter permease subunit, partial [Rubripirellula sp.]